MREGQCQVITWVGHSAPEVCVQRHLPHSSTGARQPGPMQTPRTAALSAWSPLCLREASGTSRAFSLLSPAQKSVEGRNSPVGQGKDNLWQDAEH